jgi:hypothetical protein
MMVSAESSFEPPQAVASSARLPTARVSAMRACTVEPPPVISAGAAAGALHSFPGDGHRLRTIRSRGPGRRTWIPVGRRCSRAQPAAHRRSPAAFQRLGRQYHQYPERPYSRAREPRKARPLPGPDTKALPPSDAGNQAGANVAYPPAGFNGGDRAQPDSPGESTLRPDGFRRADTPVDHPGASRGRQATPTTIEVVRSERTSVRDVDEALPLILSSTALVLVLAGLGITLIRTRMLPRPGASR